jgi:hypothetical protein
VDGAGEDGQLMEEVLMVNLGHNTASGGEVRLMLVEVVVVYSVGSVD